ncbi:MAG: hypothetical protein ACREFD_12050 [Stellaceae bacterium]
MRWVLMTLGLLLLGACAPNQMASNAPPNLQRYIVPSGGAAYAQSDMRYYENGANPGYAGPSGYPSFHH